MVEVGGEQAWRCLRGSAEEEFGHIRSLVDASRFEEAAVLRLRLNAAQTEISKLRGSFRLRTGEMAFQDLDGDGV